MWRKFLSSTLVQQTCHAEVCWGWTWGRVGLQTCLGASVKISSGPLKGYGALERKEICRSHGKLLAFIHFFVCSATATTVYFFDVSTDISTCLFFEHIIYIYIILHFCGHLLERRIPPDSSSSPKTCGCLPWVFGKVFRPSGWTDRVQTTNFCFCRLFGPDGAPKGGEGGGKGVVLVRPSAIDFLRLKHYKDFFWDFQAATLVLESRPVWVFLVVPC